MSRVTTGWSSPTNWKSKIKPERHRDKREEAPRSSRKLEQSFLAWRGITEVLGTAPSNHSTTDSPYQMLTGRSVVASKLSIVKDILDLQRLERPSMPCPHLADRPPVVKCMMTIAFGVATQASMTLHRLKKSCDFPRCH